MLNGDARHRRRPLAGETTHSSAGRTLFCLSPATRSPVNGRQKPFPGFEGDCKGGGWRRQTCGRKTRARARIGCCLGSQKARRRAVAHRRDYSGPASTWQHHLNITQHLQPHHRRGRLAALQQPRRHLGGRARAHGPPRAPVAPRARAPAAAGAGGGGRWRRRRGGARGGGRRARGRGGGRRRGAARARPCRRGARRRRCRHHGCARRRRRDRRRCRRHRRQRYRRRRNRRHRRRGCAAAALQDAAGARVAADERRHDGGGRARPRADRRLCGQREVRRRGV